MSRKETAPMFSVVNGKLMRATSTARVEVRPTEAAAALNELLAVLARIAFECTETSILTDRALLTAIGRYAGAAIDKATRP